MIQCRNFIFPGFPSVDLELKLIRVTNKRAMHELATAPNRVFLALVLAAYWHAFSFSTR
jgi:hypothetical protein